MSVMILDTRHYQAVRNGLVVIAAREGLCNTASHLLGESDIDIMVQQLYKANVRAYNDRYQDEEKPRPLHFSDEELTSSDLPDPVQTTFALHSIDYQIEDNGPYPPNEQMAIGEMHHLIAQLSRRIIVGLAEERNYKWEMA